MMQSKKFAVTGGIGSGKSAVCRLIAKRGFPVFSCDEISHALWEEPEYRKGLAERFPACTAEGEIDKKLLGNLVFSDPEARMRLERYSHPRIMERLFSAMDAEPFSFAEVPLLFEGGYERLFDGAVVVRREKDARIAAVQARDGLTRDEILRRMQNQCGEEARRGAHCYFIDNDGSLSELDGKVGALLADLQKLP